MTLVLFHVALMTFSIFMYKSAGQPIMFLMALLNAALAGFMSAFALVDYLVQKQKEREDG